jgi:hypothetical protein
LGDDELRSQQPGASPVRPEVAELAVFPGAQEYLAEMGRAEAARLWKEYPLLGYGKGWDDAEL